MNHFETVCKSFLKKPSRAKFTKKSVHQVDTSDWSDSDENYSVWTLYLEGNVHSAHSLSDSVHTTMNTHGKEITFQLDSGATCNILPSGVILSMPQLQPTKYKLKMYNKSTIKPLGKTHFIITNPNKCYLIQYSLLSAKKTACPS